jgi:uncharacterized protein (TIGR02246 family)
MPIAVDADRAAIRSTTAELLAAVNASDPDRVLALWREEGILMPPHHPVVHGHAALREYFRELFRRSTLTFQFTSSDIQLFGDLAVERLSYTATVLPMTGGTPANDVGKGLHVYLRDAGGSWKLLHDIWNSDRAAGSPT